MMAAALNATGRPIAFSCSWPAYEGGLPPEVSRSVCPPGTVPHTRLPHLLCSQGHSYYSCHVLICGSGERVLSTPEGPLPA